MEFLLWLKLKIVDCCKTWRIHHFVTSEVQLQSHSLKFMRFLFCSRVLVRFLWVWIYFRWISGCVVQTLRCAAHVTAVTPAHVLLYDHVLVGKGQLFFVEYGSNFLVEKITLSQL